MSASSQDNHVERAAVDGHEADALGQSRKRSRESTPSGTEADDEKRETPLLASNDDTMVAVIPAVGPGVAADTERIEEVITHQPPYQQQQIAPSLEHLAAHYHAAGHAANPATHLDDRCCVRLGVFHPPVSVTKEQVVDELDAIKMTSRVESIIMEDLRYQYQYNQFHERGAFWARIYFSSPEVADVCAVELNVPFRVSKWKHLVTQRLPRLGPGCGEIRTIPAFEPFYVEPADSVAVEVPEGFVVFSTDELYTTKGAVDYLHAKQRGEILQRELCSTFDPQRRLVCDAGLNCSCIHVKAMAMWKVLLPVIPKHPLRNRYSLQRTEPSRIEGGEGGGSSGTLTTSLWEFSRRLDTLVVRYLPVEHDGVSLRYMFAGCEGYADSFIQCTREGKRFGFVRFMSREAALKALQQTAGSDLNISFYGVMEDIRLLQQKQQHMIHQEHQRRVVVKPHGSAEELLSAIPHPAVATASTEGNAAEPTVSNAQVASEALRATVSVTTSGLTEEVTTATSHLPFPPLPEGWEFSVIRRTSQYCFFQPKKKNCTTFKHPITGERYTCSK